MMHYFNRLLIRTIWLPMSVVAFSVIILLIWAFDRSPPMRFKGNVQVAQVTQHIVQISYEVERYRFCDLTVQRAVRDADGYRFQLADGEYDADEIHELEQETPGRVQISLPIPNGARRGPMILRVKLSYECNPLHRLWPITIGYSIPFVAD